MEIITLKTFFPYFQVNVSLNLRNIFEVNEKAQYITLETSLRMYWKDERIQGIPIGNVIGVV